MLSELQTGQFSDLQTNWLRTDQPQNHLTVNLIPWLHD